MALPSAKLNDQYIVQRSLDESDPFAVTYLGQRTEDGQPVLIREYFPRHLAERTGDRTVRPRGEEETFDLGLRYFLKEGEVLAGIEHPNLRPEQERFRANGTAYRVSAYRKGILLATALKKSEGGRLDEKTALTIVQPVLEALQAAHEKGLLHGGLSAKAIHLTRDRTVLLQNFRSAHLQLAHKTKRLEEVTIDGMSAPEQYDLEGRTGPWTDVYAAAALLYRLIAGERLPEATQLSSHGELAGRIEGVDGISEGRARALQQALAPRPEHRMQSAWQFNEALEHSSPASAASVAEDADTEKTPGEVPAAGEEAPSKDTSAPQEAAATEAASMESASMESAEAGAGEETGGAAWGPAAAAAAVAAAAKKRRKRGPAFSEKAGTAETAPRGRQDHGASTSAGTRESGKAPLVLPIPGLPVSNRLALAAGAFLLVVVLGGAALLFTGALGGGESSSRTRYESLLAEGDSLFGRANYQAARQRYEQVRALRPEAETPDGRIAERLEEIEQRQRATRKKSYDRAMRRADSLKRLADARAGAGGGEGLGRRARGLYQKAEEAYLTAYDNRPDDSLALARAKVVGNVLSRAATGQGVGGDAPEEALADGERQRLYERYRQQGDEALQSGDFEAARRKFREALDYNPGSDYVSGKLEGIRGLISEAEREKQYRRYRRRADALFSEDKIAEARREYQLALDVVPGDDTSATRIEAIDERLAQRQERQQQYQYHRGRGDVFFDEGQFQKSVASYREALAYRPDDSYVKNRIAEARQNIETASEEAKEAAAAKKAGETKKRRMTENGVYKMPDAEPVLVGGLAALHKRIDYPARARQRGVEGRVYLRVTVSETGAVEDVEVLKGIGAGCDEAAARAARRSEFRPATVGGRPVPAYKTLLVRFRIKQ